MPRSQDAPCKTYPSGEVATPGNVLLTAVQLDPVKLTLYEPETRLGQEHKPGIPADVILQ